jgi:hypothetical protein
MYGCKTCGSHAFSADGEHWTYTGEAYTALTKYTDGTFSGNVYKIQTFYACFRV